MKDLTLQEEYPEKLQEDLDVDEKSWPWERFVIVHNHAAIAMRMSLLLFHGTRYFGLNIRRAIVTSSGIGWKLSIQDAHMPDSLELYYAGTNPELSWMTDVRHYYTEKNPETGLREKKGLSFWFTVTNTGDTQVIEENY